MIIIMLKDIAHTKGGEVLRKRYYADDDTQLAVFNGGCFANLHDTRVTFLGHADSKFFGGCTPEDFVEKLTNPVWGANLPKNVTDIDLVGCEIGFIRQGESYVRKVARLFGDKGYELRIHAFSNLHAGEELAGMLVYVFDDGNATVKAWTQNNAGLVNSLRDELKTLSDKIKEYDEKILELQRENSNMQGKTIIISHCNQNILDNDREISELKEKVLQNIDIATNTDAINALIKENKNYLKTIEETKLRFSLLESTIKKNELEITQLSDLRKNTNERTTELQAKLVAAQNEIVMVGPSPLRETLSSNAAYQVVTSWKVPIEVTPLSTSNSSPTLLSAQGTAFIFQEHRGWETQKDPSKWSSDKFSEPKLLPPTPKFDDNSPKKVVNQDNPSESKEEKSHSSPRLGRH